MTFIAPQRAAPHRAAPQRNATQRPYPFTIEVDNRSERPSSNDAETVAEAIARLDAALARYGLKRGDVRPEVTERLRRRDS